MSGQQHRAGQRVLLAHMGDGRRLLLAGFGLIVVDALAQSAAPAVFRVVLNRIEADPAGFVDGGWRGPAVAAVLVALSFAIAAYLAHTFTRRGAARWAHLLRRRLFEHVQRLSLDVVQRWQAGNVAARINQDIERVELAVWHALALLWASVMLIAGVALIAWIDLRMAAWAFGLLAGAAVWSVLVMPRLRRRSRDVRDELGTTAATVTEMLGVHQLIKAFNAEAHVAAQVSTDSSRVLDRSEALARLQFRYSDAMGFHLAFVAPFVLLFIGAWRVAGGSLLIGDVVAIWAIWQRSSGALTAIVNGTPEVLTGLVAGERAAEILWEEPAVDDRANAPALQITDASIAFKGVSFAYPGRPSERVLTDIDLHISGGERLAIVGPSGAGKSTLVQLLLRFHDPSKGTVSIDGQDLRAVRQDSVRSAIGVVFQDSVLLSGSLARNLRVARPEASDDDLREALVAANAWEFVKHWESGLGTEVGERGALLSGGQRQRLAIARVILKDPPIVVLDEATSALDADSERLVLAALERLLDGRTSLVIAHRMATVRRADRIIVVERGGIAAAGEHEALLQTSPTYHSYCREQLIA